MASSDKTVKVKLQLDQTGDAASKMKDLEALANRTKAAFADLETQIDKTNKAAGQVGGRPAFGGLNGQTGFNSAGSGGGGFARSRLAQGLESRAAGTAIGRGMGAGSGAAAAGPAAVALGAYMALAEVAGKVGQAMNVLNNSSLTTAQQFEKLSDEYMPGAKALRTFVEAVNGTTEGLRRAQLRFEYQHAMQAAQAENRARVAQEQRGVDSARAQIMATTGGVQYRKYEGQRFDRSTYGGEVGYGEYQRRLEAADAVTHAQRQRAAAGSTVLMRANDVRAAHIKLQLAQEHRDAAYKEYQGVRQKENMGYRDKLGMDRAVKGMQLAQQDVLARVADEEKAINALKDAQNDKVQKQGELQARLVEQKKMELSIEDAKLNRMEQATRRAGSMNAGQYQNAKAAALAVQRFGLDNATPQMIDMARSLAPGMVGKLEEARGAGRAQELQRLGLGDFQDFKNGNNLQDQRIKVDQIRADVRVTIDLNEKTLAQELTKGLKDVLEDLVKNLKVQAEEKGRAVIIGQQKQAAMQ
jgi:hypothetical protein